MFSSNESGLRARGRIMPTGSQCYTRGDIEFLAWFHLVKEQKKYKLYTKLDQKHAYEEFQFQYHCLVVYLLT